MVYISWSNPTRWQLLIPRVGDMHWVMNYVDSVSKLMEGSGINKSMVSAFAGVEKMLVSRKFRINVRALRLVATELLCGFINDIKDYNEFDLFLKRISEESVLSEHWVKNLVQPVLLMLLYIRGEREEEFSLHLYACKKMIPYFLLLVSGTMQEKVYIIYDQ